MRTLLPPPRPLAGRTCMSQMMQAAEGPGGIVVGEVYPIPGVSCFVPGSLTLRALTSLRARRGLRARRAFLEQTRNKRNEAGSSMNDIDFSNVTFAVASRLPSPGAIGDEEVLAETLPCWKAHPGACITKDAQHWSNDMDVATKAFLQAGLAGVFSAGDFVVLQALVEAGHYEEWFWMVCHIRK